MPPIRTIRDLLLEQDLAAAHPPPSTDGDSRAKRLRRAAVRKTVRLARRIRATKVGERIHPYIAANGLSRRIWDALKRQARSRPPSRPKPALPYSNFGEYLSHAIVNPLMKAPFTEADRRILGVMDTRRRQLARRYGPRASEQLVSVIFTTAGAPERVREALGSVCAQSHTCWELLVIDDGSVDDLSGVVRAFGDSRIRLHGVERDCGLARARNVGVAHTRGTIVAYLDGHNTWHEDYLLILVGALQDQPEAEVAYCAQEIWRTTGSEGRTLGAVRFAPFNRSLLEHRNYLDANAVVHMRSIFQRLGGFHEELSHLIDWDLALRYTEEQGALAVPCILSSHELLDVDDEPGNEARWNRSREQVLGLVDRHTVSVPTADPGDDTVPLRVCGPPTRPPEAARRPFTIVMPSFGALPYLRTCIESVLAHSDLSDGGLIVVDNGSGADVVGYLRSLEDSSSTRVLLNEVNLGFTHAVNQGIEEAGRGQDILLLNNDAVVTPGWVEAMWQVVEEVPDAGMVVPRQVLFPGTTAMRKHVPFSVMDRELDASLSAHHRNVVDPFFDWRRGYVELAFAPFFCVYIPHEVIDQVGLLNVDHGAHYRSDRVYCDAVRHFAEKRIIYTPHSKVYHFLKRSTKELRRNDPTTYQSMVRENTLSRALDMG